ncbi:MAG: ABC transporter substrate-binding protein [Alcaligenaceae bacterium]|nr:ABC transporter substrate-binding protein [Alcaligenaceae bacterium]
MKSFKKTVLGLSLGLLFVSPVFAADLVLNNGSEPESLDPHKVSGTVESHLLRQLLEGLVVSGEQGAPAPGVAESWSSPDNKVWTFNLRKDAKWSNGDPVTANDFVYSFRRIVDPKTASPYSTYLGDAKIVNANEIVEGKMAPETLGVRAVDDYTFEVTLSTAVPYLPDMLIHTSTFPVNKKVVEEFGDKWTSPEHFVGNGAYKLDNWRVNDKIDMSRSKTYWRDDKTSINTVTFLPIVEPNAAVRRFEAGEIDYHQSIPSELFNSLKAKYPDEVHVNPQLCTYMYYLNTQKGPFADSKLRRAFTLVADRELITDKILRQNQIPAYTFTPSYTHGVKQVKVDFQDWDQAKRLEVAKKLFAEAGYSAEHPLNITLLYNTSESHKKLAVALTSMVQKAFGRDAVNVNLNNQEWKTYLETQRKGDFDISRGGWCADYNEPSTFLNLFKSTSANNTSKYVSAEYDALLEETLKPGVDVDKRAELYQQAELQLSKDTPMIPVYYYSDTSLVKKKIEGWPFTDAMNNFYVRTLKIK